jgi:endonuclease YncB( thermonuclease family)
MDYDLDVAEDILSFEIKKEVKHLDCISLANRAKAKNQKRGMWSQENYISPKEYRKINKGDSHE